MKTRLILFRSSFNFFTMARYALVQLLNNKRKCCGDAIYFQQTLGQWREVFYLAAAVDLGANLFYLFFASTEEQVRFYLTISSFTQQTTICITQPQKSKQIFSRTDPNPLRAQHQATEPVIVKYFLQYCPILNESTYLLDV